MDEHLTIHADTLLLICLEPAGFEFVLRPGDTLVFASAEPPVMDENGIARSIHFSDPEFRMRLNGTELEEPPTMLPTDIVEIEIARLPHSLNLGSDLDLVVSTAQAMEFLYELTPANAQVGVALMENVAQLSFRLATTFPAQASVFTMMQNITVRLLAHHAISLMQTVVDFGKQLHDAGRTDAMLGNQPDSTRRLLASSCRYPAAMKAGISTWCKPNATNVEPEASPDD